MNSVNISGRLVRDLELQKTADNKSYLKFTLAVDKEYKAKEGAPTADFINCSVWGQPADYLAQYAVKGSWVEVEGKLVNNNFTNKEGKQVFQMEVQCQRVKIVGSRPGQGQGQTQAQGTQPAQPAQPAQQPAPAPQQQMYNPQQGYYQQPAQQPAPAPQQQMYNPQQGYYQQPAVPAGQPAASPEPEGYDVMSDELPFY